MNKAELIDALATRLGDKRTASTALDAVLAEIQTAVTKGDRVAITGFGVFEKRVRAARTARNPRTGESVKVKKTSVPAFRPGQGFKEQVASGKVAKAAAKKTTAGAAKKTTAASKAAPAKASAAKSTAKAAPAKTTRAAKSTATKAAPAKKATKATRAAATPARKTTTATAAPAKTVARKAPARKTTAR